MHAAVASGILLGLLCAASAHASGAMTDHELDTVRGGYLTANGLTFGFGAQIQTYVNGVLALQSTLTLNGANVLDAQSQVMGQAASAAAPGGLVLAGDGGATTIVHSITSSQILSVVLNSANNQNITQNTHVNITLPGFASTQQNAAFQQLSSGLQASLSFGLSRASGH